MACFEELTISFYRPVVGKSAQDINVEAVVKGVMANDQHAIRQLYDLLYGSMLKTIARQLSAELVHDTAQNSFLEVVASVRKGSLRDPKSLSAFARTVVQRQIVRAIKGIAKERRMAATTECDALPAEVESPDKVLVRRERIAIMKRVLGEMSEQDRRILSLFYLGEATQEDICARMCLTETQFRLLKSRAKFRFEEQIRRFNQRSTLSGLCRQALQNQGVNDSQRDGSDLMSTTA